ncbi:MAG: phospholipase, partial [Micromonosporaceae bacterium]|nr:phospholipase [Micromonosporaceae bacterium]
MRRTLRRCWMIITPATALCLAVAVVSPASAATRDEKLAVLKTWSQATAKSARAWNTARQGQQPWTPYSFDWSTDHCS